MNQFLKEYLAVLRLEKNLSENTVASYKNDLNSFFGFLSDRGVEDPSEIKNQHLENFFKSLADTGLSSSSAARYFSSVKGFFRYLYLNKYITDNPVDKISAPKLSKNLPDVQRRPGSRRPLPARQGSARNIIRVRTSRIGAYKSKALEHLL